MDETFLYELVARKYIYDYREQLEKDNSDNLSKCVAEGREALEKALNKEQLKLVDRYLAELDYKNGYINLMTGTRILNYGIKIGMNLQKSFDEYEEF